MLEWKTNYLKQSSWCWSKHQGPIWRRLPSWLCYFFMLPSLSAYKISCPLIVSGRESAIGQASTLPIAPHLSLFQFNSVHALGHVWLFVTPWTAAHQASLSITNSRSLFKLLSTESVMPSNHLIPLSSPSPSIFNLFQHQGLFKWVSSSYQVAKVLEFQLQHQSFQWIFRTDFF